MNISVVIPCYNCEKYIEKTIESILNQNILPNEIILINDNSKDNTLDILYNISKKNNMIKVFSLDVNKGPSFSRNYGVDNSKGDYILFLDSDDLALPNLIEESIKKMYELNREFSNKYVLSYCSYIQIDENDNIINNKPIKGIQVEPKEILGYEILRNYISSTSGVFIKKEYFYKSGKFNENLGHSEDWDLWLKIAQIGGFLYINKPLIKLRRSNNSLSSNLKSMRIGEKLVLSQYSIDFIEKAINNRNLPQYINTCDFVSMMFRLERYDEGFKKLKELNKYYEYYSIYFLMGLYYIKNRQIDLALDNFFKTIKLNQKHGAALNNIGALYILENNKIDSTKFLNMALECFPNFMDANYNLDLVYSKRNKIDFDDVKFTYRELRSTLLKYNS